MNETLAVRAEILKLARLLGRNPQSLDYLTKISPEDIRALREQITDALFDAHGKTLQRLAAASKLLPVGLVAAIGERAFGATLSARIAGLLAPARAAEIAATMPLAFLADMAVEIDPRRANAVIAQIPPSRIADITCVLAEREEYVTMGRFVGPLPKESLAAAIGALDDAALLRVAFVLEAKRSLAELASLLGEVRVVGIIEAAARENLWVEALDLLSNLTDEQRIAFAQRAGAMGQEDFDSLIGSARELEMWQSLLPLAAHLSPNAQDRAARAVQKLKLTPDERDRVLEYARREGLLGRLGPVQGALAA